MDISTLLSMLGNPNLSQAQAQMLLGQLQDFFSQTSGFARTQLDTQTQLSRDQLAQNNAQFQANLQLQRDQMTRLQIPQLEINRQLANMEDEHFKAQLGLSYLTQASQFAASDPFALSDFMRGATKNPGVPVYLQNMMNNVAQGTGGAVGPEAPKAVTLNTLGQAMGGPSAAIGGGAAAGGQGATQVAPGVTLNQGGAPGSYGPGVTTTYNAPGPNSPNDTTRGTLEPGTTGMFQGAAQNKGIGPGQGSNTLSGTRGTNIVGYDPVGHKLTFDYNFLENKPRAVFTLVDKTTGGYVTPSNTDEATTAGTEGQTGWMSQPYLSGSNGRATFSQLNDIDPTHTYRIQVALPQEGGGTGNAFEQDGSGADSLARSSSPAGASTPAASSVGPAAGQTPSTTDTSTPSVGPNGFSQTNPAELAMGFLFNQGADKLAPGTIESLSPEELANLGQGVNHLYGQQAMPSFLEAYRRSRPSQTAAQGSYFAG